MHQRALLIAFFYACIFGIQVARDPRFDDLSGKLNPDLFQKSYDFIESYQSTEKKVGYY